MYTLFPPPTRASSSCPDSLDAHTLHVLHTHQQTHTQWQYIETTHLHLPCRSATLYVECAEVCRNLSTVWADETHLSASCVDVSIVLHVGREWVILPVLLWGYRSKPNSNSEWVPAPLPILRSFHSNYMGIRPSETHRQPHPPPPCRQHKAYTLTQLHWREETPMALAS